MLLKNRLETFTLKNRPPLRVVGPLADSKRDVMGSWSAAGVADQSVTVLTGIKIPSVKTVKCCMPKGRTLPVTKALSISESSMKKRSKSIRRSPQEMIDEAVQTAKQSDVVVAVVGEAQGWRTKPPAGPISLFRKANVT